MCSFFCIYLRCVCFETSQQQVCSCNYLLCLWICHVSGESPNTPFTLKGILLQLLRCLNMLVFTVIMFLSPCLLHHWTMWPFSQWNSILLLYTQECFSPGEWQDKLAVLWLFLKCISMRHCLPWFSYHNAFHTSCQNEHTPLDSKAFSPKVHLLFFFSP